MSRRRVRVRPGKASSALGFGVGVLFVLIGLFVAVPNFGLFGLVWTGVPLAITVVNGVNAFGKKGVPTMEIYAEEDEAERTPEERLATLQSLYDRRLITAEEYERKRSEILKEL